jgi:hypothetical protein
MTKSLIILACFILFACHHRQKEAIDKAIRLKEIKKGNRMDDYSVLRTLDTLNNLTVYYQAELTVGDQTKEIQDSVVFYETGDGILQAQP